MGSIALKSVTKAFGDVVVIPEVDLNIADGEFVVFVGPSGCGKSTLLRLIAGLEDVSGGSIQIDAVRAMPCHLAAMSWQETHQPPLLSWMPIVSWVQAASSACVEPP